MYYDVFKKLCEERGVRPSDVSRATGISSATLTNWKKGNYTPKEDKMKLIADYFGVTTDFLRTGEKTFSMTINNADVNRAIRSMTGRDLRSEFEEQLKTIFDELPIQIPVVRRVAAGIPFDSQDECIGYEEISKEMAKTGTYFGLEIKGDSMEPGIIDKDRIIVRQQEDAEDGQIVVALINGDDGCCKRLKKYDNGTIALVSDNASYPPMYFNTNEIDSTPVKIMGVVKELRRKL